MRWVGYSKQAIIFCVVGVRAFVAGPMTAISVGRESGDDTIIKAERGEPLLILSSERWLNVCIRQNLGPIFQVVDHLKYLAVWFGFWVRWNHGRDEIRREIFILFFQDFQRAVCRRWR